MGLWNRVKSGLGEAKRNATKSWNSLFGDGSKTANTIKAITNNTQHLVHQGVKLVNTGVASGFASGTARGAGIGAVLIPVAGALNAVDLTLKGVQEVEKKLLGDDKPTKLKDGDFIKETQIGRGAEQFLRGNISDRFNVDLSGINNLINPIAEQRGTIDEVRQARGELSDLDKVSRDRVNREGRGLVVLP